MNRFDRAFWSRFWRVAKVYWLSEDRRDGVRLVIIVAALSLAGIGLAAYGSYLYRDSTDALVGKHGPQFYHLMLVWTAFTVVSLPVGVYTPWFAGRLHIVWREWLTHHLVALGFSHRAFYRMGQRGKVDNPDQRIADDVSAFVASTQTFTVTLASSIGRVVTYAAILWSISHSLASLLVAYSMLGTYFTVVIGRRLIGINYDQERYQADFRFGLIHVRDNVEPIFMFGGEQHESVQLTRRFADVVRNFNLLIDWERNLRFFTESYGGVVALVPYWFLASRYFAGNLDYGKMVQAALAFIAMNAAISIIVTTFPSLASYATVVNRLGGFLDECDAASEDDQEGRERIATTEDGRVAFRQLTVLTPDGSRTLIANLSADATALQPLLIKGPSGVGKTSLLRALAGLWREGSGTITRPALADVMFLPQRPYMILGSLRDQLTYPRAGHISDGQLLGILAELNLGDLPERFGGLDAELPWAEVLSPGEQQRIAFARLLLNRPACAFLDEATSALDVPNEEQLYERLADSGISYLSSGHRPTLLRFHRNVLELRNDGDWRVQPSAEFTSPPRAA